MVFGKSLAASLFALCLAALTAPAAYAQVSVTLELNNANYLQYETVYAKVTMRNYSAHPLAFGENKELSGRLKFEIELPAEGYAQPTPAGLPPMVGVILAPGASKTMSFALSDYYDVKAKGKYRVKAIVEHSQLTTAYESNSAIFTVIDGVPIWERQVGIPDYVKKTDEGKPVQTRKYKIVSIFDGKSKVYLLVVEDERSVYSVKRIGFDMGYNLKPSCEIDSLSRLNVLLPVNPKVFAFYLYSIEGKLERREVYLKTQTTPTLVADAKDGTVMIVGGRAARKDLDYEEFKDLPFMEKIENKNVEDED